MAKPTYLEGQTCPKCKRHLIVKESEQGLFLACPAFPMCKFTKPLPGGDMKIYQAPSPYCEKCNHTGLLPFVKNGRTIAFAWVDCECRYKEQEHYQVIKTDDFDFPMSDTFRGFSYQYCNQVDPGYVPPEREPMEAPALKVIEHRHSDISVKDFEEIRQLRFKLDWLEKQFNEREKKKEDYY